MGARMRPSSRTARVQFELGWLQSDGQGTVGLFVPSSFQHIEMFLVLRCLPLRKLSKQQTSSKTSHNTLQCRHLRASAPFLHPHLLLLCHQLRPPSIQMHQGSGLRHQISLMSTTLGTQCRLLHQPAQIRMGLHRGQVQAVYRLIHTCLLRTTHR